MLAPTQNNIPVIKQITFIKNTLLVKKTHLVLACFLAFVQVQN